MRQLDSFSKEDGHIESILIGCRVVKVSFQTWDCKQIVIIFNDVEKLEEQNSVFGDIGRYEENKSQSDFTVYRFFDSDNNMVLSIQAKSVEIFEIGGGADLNSALFDVGYDYVGSQKHKAFM